MKKVLCAVVKFAVVVLSDGRKLSFAVLLLLYNVESCYLKFVNYSSHTFGAVIMTMTCVMCRKWQKETEKKITRTF